MSRVLRLAPFVLTVFLAGCLHPRIGPNSIPRDRAAYSDSVSDSWKEQTLLNIVKLRYIDPPIFVDVGNIVASYTISGSASASGNIPVTGGGSASVGGAVGYSHSPTITYTPLTGSDYIRTLITPLPVSVVFAAIQNGLPADSIMLSLLKSINGLRNQSVDLEGIRAADPEFHRVRELVEEIQSSDAVRLVVKSDEKSQEKTLLTLRKTSIPADIRDDEIELRRLLRLDPDATEFSLVSAPLPASNTEIAVQTRSIDELLQNAAAQVEVPPEDLEKHRAIPGFATGHDVPGVIPMMRIHSSKSKPSDAFVSVNYRDTWFFIDDGDLVSKRALAELMELFTMADTGAKAAERPVLTIPAR